MSDMEHGRKSGPKETPCGQCRWIDTSNAKVGTPPGLGCRLVRGVTAYTQSCDQFKPRGAKLDREKNVNLVKARKKLKFRRRKIARKVVGDCITTGSYYLDLVTGGGIQGGKLVVYYGPEHSGKTTLCFKTMAATLAAGIPVDGWDAEESWDKDYMIANGVDPDHPLMTIEAHDNGDDYYNYLVYLLRELPDQDDGPPQMLIVCDSAAALLPKLTAGDPEKESMAGPALTHSSGLRKIKGLLGRKRVAMIFTNHTGEKPGVSFGNPEYEKGGNALKFYSDLRVRVGKRGATGNGVTQLPSPAFRSIDKGGLTRERSWTGRGKDRFGYAHLSIKKNKGFSGGHQAFVRINTSCGGGPGMGLDLAYDIFQCLVMTGQAKWLGKQRMSISLKRPRYKDGKMSHLKVRGFWDTAMDWVTFCELVHNHGKGKKKGPDLEDVWQLQQASGWALEQFYRIEAEK